MKNPKKSEKEVIEAEILDENGLPVTAEDVSEQAAHYRHVKAGFMTGFLALAFSFIMILVMAVVTVFIIFPLMLLGRIFGMQVKSFRR